MLLLMIFGRACAISLFNYLALLLQACESVFREDIASGDIGTHMVDVWKVDSW